MRMQKTAALAILAILFVSTAYGRESYVPKTEEGDFRVRTLSETWRDPERNRDIPVKVYYPDTGRPSPVIVFSHGLGGSREGYEFLGRYWASHGYVSVHPQHPGSDESVMKQGRKLLSYLALQKAAADVQNALDRPRDISFVIDGLEVANRSRGPLRGRLDLRRIGVAGHSFGAYTALVSAGRILIDPMSDREIDLSDSRVKACLAMSAPAKTRDLRNGGYDDFTTPVFHMTGTKDESPIGGTKAEDRTIPFRAIRKAEQYLVNFKDGDHMIFSGQRLRGGDGAKDPVYRLLIRMGSLAFWDYYLNDDDAAGDWLQDRDGYERWVGKEGTFETRMPSSSLASRDNSRVIIIYRNADSNRRRFEWSSPRSERYDSRRDDHHDSRRDDRRDNRFDSHRDDRFDPRHDRHDRDDHHPAPPPKRKSPSESIWSLIFRF